MAGYSREFLIDAFVHRYTALEQAKLISLRGLANSCYDQHGKEKFRVYASLDADTLRKFKLETGRKS